MKRRRFDRRPTPPLCDLLGPLDGVDPRDEKQLSSRRVHNRKALQLCAEVMRTLNEVLACETGDDLLRDLLVVSVVPAPDAMHLMVTLIPSSTASSVDRQRVLERLDQAAGLLRAEVAAAIHRRKTPELVFRISGSMQ